MNLVMQNLLVHKLVMVLCHPLSCLSFGHEMIAWYYVLDVVGVLGLVHFPLLQARNVS